MVLAALLLAARVRSKALTYLSRRGRNISARYLYLVRIMILALLLTFTLRARNLCCI
jgi:hypothetical protein